MRHLERKTSPPTLPTPPPRNLLSPTLANMQDTAEIERRSRGDMCVRCVTFALLVEKCVFKMSNLSLRLPLSFLSLTKLSLCTPSPHQTPLALSSPASIPPSLLPPTLPLTHPPSRLPPTIPPSLHPSPHPPSLHPSLSPSLHPHPPSLHPPSP